MISSPAVTFPPSLSVISPWYARVLLCTINITSINGNVGGTSPRYCWKKRMEGVIQVNHNHILFLLMGWNYVKMLFRLYISLLIAKKCDKHNNSTAPFNELCGAAECVTHQDH
jgi:hypothetical protein